MKNLILLFAFVYGLSGFSQETVTYASTDDLQITADVYKAESDSDTFIILFHQAGYSRGEYTEIAPKLNSLGYHAMAVDQRSGNAVNGVKNQTKIEAKKAGKKTKYINAFPDVKASVDYVKNTYNPEKIIIWGSSYSSSLVLKYAGDFPDAVDAVLSFSPGEYFGSKGLIAESAKDIKIPSFITSSRGEKKSWSKINESISSGKNTTFVPNGSGNHGSKALWTSKSDHKEYWEAVTAFLKTI